MIKDLNFKTSFDKAKAICVLQFALMLIVFFAEANIYKTIFTIPFFFQFVLLIIFFNFYYQALVNLYYSFWNLSFLIAIYYSIGFVRNFLFFGHEFIGLIYGISITLLVGSSYILSSPLFFPRVNWWEYDFRFRSDIHVIVETQDKQLKGRLSDLRRGAGCLELFFHCPVGTLIELHVEILSQRFSFQAELRSKKEPIIGRSIIYGIKFISNDLETKQKLKLLSNYWKETKKIKIRNKFSLTNPS